MNEVEWACESLGFGSKQSWMPTASNQGQSADQRLDRPAHHDSSIAPASDFNPKGLDT
jgi:hypothetical protein